MISLNSCARIIFPCLLLLLTATSEAQQPDQPTIKESLQQLHQPDHTTGQPGFELPMVKEEPIHLAEYHKTDENIFSLMDFLKLVNQQFPNDNPWIRYKEFSFRLEDHAKYISLKAGPFNASKVIYDKDQTVQEIFIE